MWLKCLGVPDTTSERPSTSKVEPYGGGDSEQDFKGHRATRYMHPQIEHIELLVIEAIVLTSFTILFPTWSPVPIPLAVGLSIVLAAFSLPPPPE
jgi:hypothetical protein